MKLKEAKIYDIGNIFLVHDKENYDILYFSLDNNQNGTLVKDIKEAEFLTCSYNEFNLIKDKYFQDFLDKNKFYIESKTFEIIPSKPKVLSHWNFENINGHMSAYVNGKVNRYKF
jgi:hypothetical protein